MADQEPELPHVNVPDKPEPVTQTDIPPDGGIDNSLQPTDQPSPEVFESPETPPADAAPKPELIKKSPFQARVDALTAQREQERRARVAAEERATLAEAMLKGQKPAEGEQPIQTATGLTQAQIDAMVNQRADQLAAGRIAKAQTDKLVNAGNTEFPDFTDRCNVVAALGAGDRADFMQIVTDPEIMPEGHKIIALLAEKPEEAARILAPSMSTAQMSAALVKFQMENSKPANGTVSRATAPIKPVDGVSRATALVMNDKQPMSEYAKAFMSDRAKRFARKP